MTLDRIFESAPWEETETCFRRDYCGERGMQDQDDEFLSRRTRIFTASCAN